jgi:subfamily B ATP-binding cassette protein HlyB/CyaB
MRRAWTGIEAAEAFARTVNSLRGEATILFIAHQVPRGLAVDRVAWLASPVADTDARLPISAEAKPWDTIRQES